MGLVLLSCRPATVDINCSADKLTVMLHHEQAFVAALAAQLQAVYGPSRTPGPDRPPHPPPDPPDRTAGGLHGDKSHDGAGMAAGQEGRGAGLAPQPPLEEAAAAREHALLTPDPHSAAQAAANTSSTTSTSSTSTTASTTTTITSTAAAGEALQSTPSLLPPAPQPAPVASLAPRGVLPAPTRTIPPNPGTSMARAIDAVLPTETAIHPPAGPADVDTSSRQQWARGVTGQPAPVTVLRPHTAAAAASRSTLSLKRKAPTTSAGNGSSSTKRAAGPSTVTPPVPTLDTPAPAAPRRTSRMVPLDIERLKTLQWSLACSASRYIPPPPAALLSTEHNVSRADTPAMPERSQAVGALAQQSGWIVRRGDQLLGLNYFRAQERLLYAQMLRTHRLPLLTLPVPVVLGPTQVSFDCRCGTCLLHRRSLIDDQVGGPRNWDLLCGLPDTACPYVSLLCVAGLAQVAWQSVIN